MRHSRKIITICLFITTISAESQISPPSSPPPPPPASGQTESEQALKNNPGILTH